MAGAMDRDAQSDSSRRVPRYPRWIVKLSPHFELAELMPKGPDGEPLFPPDVELFENLSAMAELLERVREVVGRPVLVHSCYRPPMRNEAVGGSGGSDHLKARAADFHVAPEGGETWQEATLAAWPRLRDQLAGFYGQIILEDRRAHTGRKGALCIHISLPSTKHPGTTDDPNRVLVSSRPQEYERWVNELA